MFPSDLEYFADTSYMTNSLLTLSEESPVKFQLKLDGLLPEEKNDAFDVGHRVHEQFLEGKNRSVVLPKGFRKAGDKWKEMQDNAPDRAIFLSQTNESMCLGMIRSLEESQAPEIMGIGTPSFEAEVPLIGEFMGVPMKGKADGITTEVDGNRTLFDLKTTRDSLSQFESKFKWGNYPRQAALYSHLSGVDEFYFVVVSKSFPYDVGVYRVTDATMRKGKNDLEKAVQNYKDNFVTKKFNKNGYTKFGTL